MTVLLERLYQNQLPIVSEARAAELTGQTDKYELIVVAKPYQLVELMTDQEFDLIGGIKDGVEIKGVFGYPAFVDCEAWCPDEDDGPLFKPS